tara:strand:- start:135 stop:401 length:267 start_codon:yes stop_codon:yes gene_type:complete
MAVTKWQKAGCCNNQYSEKVNELRQAWRNAIRIRPLNITLKKELEAEVNKERKQWLKDTLEDRKKEALKKREEIDTRKTQGLFDEFFN